VQQNILICKKTDAWNSLMDTGCGSNCEDLVLIDYLQFVDLVPNVLVNRVALASWLPFIDTPVTARETMGKLLQAPATMPSM
jgi:hypothetical protein